MNFVLLWLIVTRQYNQYGRVAEPISTSVWWEEPSSPKLSSLLLRYVWNAVSVKCLLFLYPTTNEIKAGIYWSQQRVILAVKCFVSTKRGFSLHPVCWNKERVFSTSSLLEQREGFPYNQSVGTKRGFSLQPVCWNDTTDKKSLEEMFSNLFLFNAGFGYRKSGPMQRLCRTSVQLVPGAESGCSNYSWTVQTYQVGGFLLYPSKQSVVVAL